MFDKLRKKAAEVQQSRDEARERKALQAARAEHDLWAEDVARLEALIHGLRNYHNLVDEYADSPIITKKGEEVILIAEGVVLVESRRQRGSYKGGSAGYSFRIAKGVTYRTGSHRGTYQPGPEVATPIDDGTAVVTNQRLVFAGSKQNREFVWNKLVSINIEQMGKDAAVMYLPVSNRQKVSGIGVAPVEHMDLLEERVQFGVALATGMEDRFFASLDTQLEELKAAEPTTASQPPQDLE